MIRIPRPLIESLVSDHARRPVTRITLISSLKGYAKSFFPLVALFFWIVPMRDALPTVAASFRFISTAILSVSASLLFYRLAFYSALPVPCAREKKIQRVVGLLLIGFSVLMIGIFLNRAFSGDYSGAFRAALDRTNGGCGAVIGVAGMAQFFILLRSFKRGASPNRLLTGLWIGLATGTLFSFLIQLGCANENLLHLVIWHFLPVLGLSVATGGLAKIFLKW